MDRATAAERSLQGRLAVEASWAKTADPSARTAPARAAFIRQFEDQVDPNRKLAPEERARRAEHARRAHFARMALRSAQARRRNRGAKRRDSGVNGGQGRARWVGAGLMDLAP
jgi:hypothetical protein